MDKQPVENNTGKITHKYMYLQSNTVKTTNKEQPIQNGKRKTIHRENLKKQIKERLLRRKSILIIAFCYKISLKFCSINEFPFLNLYVLLKFPVSRHGVVI